MVEYVLYVLMGYCIGGIPFGLLLTKAAGYGDIRSIGSGNIGATNVLRTGNKKLALATLLLDGGKGAFVVFLSRWLGGDENAVLFAALASITGHVFPACLKFRGGKGVATTFGVLLALSFPVGAACCLIWLAMAFAFRYSSLAALVAILCAPPAAWIFTHDETLAGICSLIALLVWIKHRANIKRLVAGEEPKIGKKKPLPETGAA